MDNEIQSLRDQRTLTRRCNSPGLEDILYQRIPVLDHGFIRVVDYMGNDSSIVQAARVSYGRGTKKVSEDKGLINYLLRHRHTTPFEMCEIKLHIKLPIFIARQWIRHRTANVNEYSARYSILDREFYIPDIENIAEQSTTNNQGRSKLLSVAKAKKVIELLKRDALQSYETYQVLLNSDGYHDIFDDGQEGIARELARMNLPVNYYTQWYWKIDLHNFMNFIALRADPHAQYEIRVYAEVMLDILRKWAPVTHDAFVNYRKDSVTLSKKALDIVRKKFSGHNISQEESGMSAREWRELMEILNQK